MGSRVQLAPPTFFYPQVKIGVYLLLPLSSGSAVALCTIFRHFFHTVAIFVGFFFLVSN